MKNVLIKNVQLLFLLNLLLLIGCSQDPAGVMINKEFCNQNEILIDNVALECPESENRYVKIFLKRGKHELKINDSPVTQFNVTGKNGLLNIAKERFVGYPIIFQTDNAFNTPTIQTSLPILNDSLIIYSNFFKTQKDLLNFIKKKQLHAMMNGKYIGENNLYSRKSWTYGLNEEIPETIEVRMNSNSSSHSVTKSKLMDLQTYHLFAMLSGEYIIEPIENDSIVDILTELYEKRSKYR